jgi:3-dehydroquinate synthase
MEDLLMYNNLIISSKISGTYSVDFIKNLSQQLSKIDLNKSIYIVDKKVLDLFNDELVLLNTNSRLVLIESCEKNKTIDYCQIVIRKLIELDVRKNDTLIAIGGGITQDIVAFISSVLFRGVDWIFFPTTLLAQCDSCIGSKSSINFDSYKNLIGTFKPPSHIYLYKGFLNTLTESEIRSGIGEMLHYYFTEGIELAEQITSQIEVLLRDRDQLEYFIINSLRIKKKIIEIDEFDESIRHIFNYGHTFGHAIEAINNYIIPHGQAITLGMDLANFISLKKELISPLEFDQLHNILSKNIPFFQFNNDNIIPYLNALSKDKKNKENKIGCILTKGPGIVEKIFIDNDDWLKQTILLYSKTFIFV